MTSITKEEQHALLKFVINWSSDPSLQPEKKNKLAKDFLKLFEKSEQPFNSLKHLSGKKNITPQKSLNKTKKKKALIIL